MSEAPHQPHRRDRLQALLDHADFGGNKSELARALGFSSGAFVHQMLKGIRPVLEKTILKAHTMKAGKYRGWFDPPAAQPMPATAQELIAPRNARPPSGGFFMPMRKNRSKRYCFDR